PIFDDCRRRTGVDATAAAAAPVILEWLVRLQVQIENERPDKEKRADRRIDETSIFSKPAEPGFAGEIALQYRAGVHVRPSGDLSPELRLDYAMQLVQAIGHHVVVVISAGISCDRSRWRSSAVIERHD